MEQLSLEVKERVLKHLAHFPSIGILRLAFDLGLGPRLVEQAVRELEREGLVEYLDEIGVVNYIPWKEGFVEAGYKLTEEAGEPERVKRVTLLDFA